MEPEAEVHFALLLVLLASPPSGIARDELAALIWPASQGLSARHNLRQTLYRLRQFGVPIHLRGGMVALETTEAVADIDFCQLLAGTAGRDMLLSIGTLPFLPGYMPRLGSAFTTWLDALRDRMDRVRRRALVDAVRSARSNARFGDIHKLAPALLELDPLNETATLALVEALVMDGSKVEALTMLDAYEREVGRVSDSLRVPARTLRRRVSESLDESLLPRKFEVPFVGREAEFRTLREAWYLASGGIGQCAVVTGEPGIGKTRICSEVLRLAVLEGAETVTYTCTTGDTLTPLSSLLGLLHVLLSRPGALGCSQDHLEHLRSVVSPAFDPRDSFTGVTSDEAYAHLVYSIAELVSALGDESPLVVFIDDAHRLHQTSWRVFTDALDRASTKRVLLLLAARVLPEWYAALGIAASDGRHRHVSLEPLPEDDVGAFLERWASKNDVVLESETRRRFSLTAAGNPFYLGELAAHRGRGGAEDSTPPSISQLLRLQFAALREESRRVLVCASLLQTFASFDRIQRTLGLTPLALASSLQELQDCGLVSVVGTVTKTKHDVISELCLRLAGTAVVHFLASRVAGVLEDEALQDSNSEMFSQAVSLWLRISDHESVSRASTRLGEALLKRGLSPDAVVAFHNGGRWATSEGQRALATFGELRALALDGAHDTIVERYGALSERTLLALCDDDRDEALLAYQAAKMFGTGEQIDLGTLEAIFRSNDASLHNRLRAAALLAMAADNDARFDAFYESKGAQVWSLAADGQSNADGLFLSVMIPAGLNDAERTVAAGHALESFASRKPPGYRIRLLRLLSEAYVRIGMHTRSRTLLQESLELAISYRLPRHVAATGAKLLSSHLHSGELSAALDLDSRLSCLEAELGLSFLTALATYRAIAAWLSEDLGRARQLLVDHCPRTSGLTMYRFGSALFYAACGLALHQPIGSDALSMLEDLGPSVGRRGGHDHSIAATVCALAAEVDASLARERWRSYVTAQRVETSPVAASICATLGRYGVTTPPSACIGDVKRHQHHGKPG